MIINIISFNNSHSLTEDAEMLCNLIKKFYKNYKIIFKYFNFQETSCSQGDVNIFLGIISNFFFKYAPINIFVCDHHKLYNKWNSYLERCDYIITKSEFSKELLGNIVPKNKIYNLGWKTCDRFNNSVEKLYNSFLCVTGLSSYRQLDTLLNIWDESYPNLTILCGKNYLKNFKITKKEQKNIIYIEKFLNDDEFSTILIKHGFHFCLSSASTFANSIHNCLSAKSIPIYLNCLPYTKVISNNINGYSVKIKKKKKLKELLGSEYILDKEDLKLIIEKVINEKDEIKFEEMSENNKKLILKNTKEFEKNFKIFFDDIRKKYKNQKKINPKYEIFNEDLPKISIITPTYNRAKFIKLMIRNYEKIDYPSNKFEWIIVDDSDKDNIENLLPKNDNINYIKLDSKITIGEKRNIAVENSKNDIIICMDDDDYYPPSSIKYRIGCLEYLNKNIVGCCSTGILEINKIISNLSVSSFIDELPKRIFESTLAFRKEWWKTHKFSETNNNECSNLFNDKNIINNFEEIAYNYVIISLLHNSNTNNRVKIKGETNGCHFNFSDELFTLITNIDDNNNSLELNKNIKNLQNKIKNQEQKENNLEK